MNCKPGDLALIVRDSKWSGWIVEVVRTSPKGQEFLAPDGTRFFTAASDWLIRGARPFGKPPAVDSCYACVPDNALRPTRDPGNDAVDETLLRPPVPSKEKELE